MFKCDFIGDHLCMFSFYSVMNITLLFIKPRYLLSPSNFNCVT